MPILDIEIVARPNESFDPHIASELANLAGEIFGSPASGTWVKVHTIASENYAENHSRSPDVYPVFVSILRAKLPSPDAMQREVERLTTTIAQVCRRPAEAVHIIYLPEGAGRVAFGGRLIGI